MLSASIKSFLRFSLMSAFGFGALLLSQMGEAEGATPQYHSFTTDYPTVYEISNFHVVSRLEIFHVFDQKQKSHSFNWQGKTYELFWLRDAGRIEVRSNKETLISLDAWELVERANTYLKNSPQASKFSVPQKVLTLQKENPRIKAKVFFDDISVEVNKDKRIFAHFKSDVYLKFK